MTTIGNQIDIDVESDRRQVLRILGYEEDAEPPYRTVSLVNEYLENVNHLVDASYSYVIKDVEWVQGAISLIEDFIIFKSGVIARLLERCQSVAVFMLTIGDCLEETVSQLAEDGLMHQAMVLDAVGSVTAEKLASLVEDRIGKVAYARGLTISRRFSPGYCDWNIGQQRMLFQALNGDTLGIRLTGTCLMIPQKSISGVIGIGPYDNDVRGYNPCTSCAKKDCIGRRTTVEV